MSNDSSTGGTLLSTTQPINDLALDQVFQSLISQLTGLALPFVRPRWQAEPTTPPDFGATWAAVGVNAFDDDQFPQQTYVDGVGLLLVRNERLDVLCSFYGPMAQQAARAARDNVLIGQNRDPLTALHIFYAYTAPMVRAPAMIQNRWTNKIDMTLTFMRQIANTYDVLAIETMSGQIAADAEPGGPVVVTNTADRPN